MAKVVAWDRGEGRRQHWAGALAGAQPPTPPLRYAHAPRPAPPPARSQIEAALAALERRGAARRETWAAAVEAEEAAVADYARRVESAFAGP